MRTDAHVSRGGHCRRAAAWWALCAVIVLSASGVSRAQEINTDAVNETAEFPRSAPPGADRIGATGAARSVPAQPAGTGAGAGCRSSSC
jgi:hypothetical protein